MMKRTTLTTLISASLLFTNCATNRKALDLIAQDIENFNKNRNRSAYVTSTSTSETYTTTSENDSAHIASSQSYHSSDMNKKSYAEQRSSESSYRPDMKAVDIADVIGDVDAQKELYRQQVIADFKGSSDPSIAPVSIDKYALNSIPKDASSSFNEELVYTIVKKNSTSLTELLNDTTATQELSQRKALYIIHCMLEKNDDLSYSSQ